MLESSPAFGARCLLLVLVLGAVTLPAVHAAEEDFRLPNGDWLSPERFIAEVRAATQAGEFTFNSIVDSFTHCFAVPVKGTDGRPIATLCLVAPRDDGLRHRQQYLDSLKQAAAELHYKDSGRNP